MSDPTSEPSCKPRFEPTNDQMDNDQTTNQRLEWDAELHNILSPKQGKYGLPQKQDAELPHKITILITQITSNTYTFEAVNSMNHDPYKIKVDNQVTFKDNQDDEIQCGSREQSKTHPSNWQGPKQRSLVISARVPFTTFRSNLSSGLVYCWVHSHTGFESVTSPKKVSCSVFALLACEPVTSSTKDSCSVFTLLAHEPITFTARVSCNTFASLVCVPATSTNQIIRDKSSVTFKLVVASVSNNSASSFYNKPSSTFQLVVASVNWKSKAVSNKPFRTLRLDRIKSQMSFTFQLIVGSKQVHQKKPQQFLVNAWLSDIISGHGPNSHESSCASQLTAHSKYLKSHETSCIFQWARAKSLRSQASYIAFGILTFPSIASTSIVDFQLIVDLFLNPYLEGVEYIRNISCNKVR